MEYSQNTADKLDFFLPDVIKDIVASIQEDNSPYFRFGNWKEISNILELLGSDKSTEATKYPLIYLSLDNTQEVLNNEENTVSFEIFIIGESADTYIASERLENVIKAILQPIYKDFIEALKNNKWFYTAGGYVPGITSGVPHTKKELYKVDSSNKDRNETTQYTDAIYLTFNNITIKKL